MAFSSSIIFLAVMGVQFAKSPRFLHASKSADSAIFFFDGVLGFFWVILMKVADETDLRRLYRIAVRYILLRYRPPTW